MAATAPPVVVLGPCGDPKCWTGIGRLWVEWDGKRWHRWCVPLPLAQAEALPTKRAVPDLPTRCRCGCRNGTLQPRQNGAQK